MSNINQVKIGSTTYDIEDSTSRNPTYTAPTTASKLTSGEAIGTALGKVSKVVDAYVDGDLGGADVWEGTEEEYEAEKDSIPAGAIILTEGEGGSGGGGSITARDTLDTGEAAPRDADTLGGTVTAETVNTISANLTASDNLKFRFATDGEGNYGYLGADDSFIPFKSGGEFEIEIIGNDIGFNTNDRITYTHTITKEYEYVVSIYKVIQNGAGYGQSFSFNGDCEEQTSLTTGLLVKKPEINSYFQGVSTNCSLSDGTYKGNVGIQLTTIGYSLK